MAKLKLQENTKPVSVAGTNSRVLIIGPSRSLFEEVAEDSILVTSSRFNASYDEVSRIIPSIIPNSALGTNLLLMDTNQEEILKKLDAGKIESIKNIHNATRAWYERTLSLGFTSEDKEDNRGGLIAKTLFTSRLMRLSPVMLAVMELGDSDLADIQKELVELYAKALSSKVKRTDSITFFDAVTSKHKFLKKSIEGDNLYGFHNAINIYVASLNDESLEERYKIFVSNFVSLLPEGSKLAEMVVKRSSDHPLLTYDFFVFLIETLLFADVSKSEGQKVRTLVEWFDVINEIVSAYTDSKITEYVSEKLFNSTAVNQVFKAYFSDKTKRAAQIIDELYDDVELTGNFTKVLSSFYSNREAMLHKSFSQTPDLAKLHRDLLVGLQSKVDVPTARQAILNFASNPLFTTSIAGLIYAQLKSEKYLDGVLVNDLLNVAVNEDVVDAFKKSPFNKDVSIRVDPGSRISDYGSGISGLSISASLSQVTEVSFLGKEMFSVGDMFENNVVQMLNSPSDITENKAHFAKMCMLMLGSERLHAELGGSSALTPLTDGIDFSKSVRDELLPTIRMINNCIGAQLFAYRESSKQWFKRELYGLYDLMTYGIHNLEAEKNHLRVRLHAEDATANMRSLRDLVAKMLETHFSVKIEDRPIKGLPVVRFYDHRDISPLKRRFSNSQLLDDRVEILAELVWAFRKSKGFGYQVGELLKEKSRTLSTLSQQGKDYRFMVHPMSIKESYFKSYEPLFRFKDETLEEVTIDTHKSVIPNHIETSTMKSQLYRDLDRVSNISGGYLMNIIRAVVNNDVLNNDDVSSIESRFNVRAPYKMDINPYVLRFCKARAKDLLTKTFKPTSLHALRAARAFYNLDNVSSAVLKLGTSPYEGIELGLSCEEVHFTSSHDRYTLEKIFEAIGLNVNMEIKAGKSVKFLMMIDNLARQGGPIKLSAKGEQVMTMGSISEYVKLVDLVSLKDHMKLSSTNVQTFTLLIRPSEMIDRIFSDYLIEDFSSLYNITIVEDGLLSQLRLSSYDESSLVLQTNREMALLEELTSDTAEAILRGNAEALANFIVPEYAFLVQGKHPQGDGNGAEEEEEETADE